MIKETRDALKHLLKQYRVTDDFKAAIRKHLSIDPVYYMEKVDPLFAVRRIAQRMSEEEGKQEMLKVAEAWESRTIVSRLGFSRELVNKYGHEMVLAAIRKLMEQGKWIAPEGLIAVSFDILETEPLSLIPDTINELSAEDVEKIVEEVKNAEEPIEEDDDDEQPFAYLPPNESPLAYLREQWRPYHQIRPESDDKDEVYIVLIDFKRESRSKHPHPSDYICGRRMIRAFWDGEQFVDKMDASVLGENEKVTAWVPFPALDLYDVDADELKVPLAMLYGDLKHKYRQLRAEYKKRERTIQRQHDTHLNDKKRLEEYESRIASHKDYQETVGKQKSFLKDYQERIDELEREVLDKTYEISAKNERIEEFENVSAQAKVFIDRQSEHIEELEEELAKVKSQPSAELPKVRTIPQSKLLELPLVGEKMLSVLEPFLKKYNIIIDPNK